MQVLLLVQHRNIWGTTFSSQHCKCLAQVVHSLVPLEDCLLGRFAMRKIDSCKQIGCNSSKFLLVHIQIYIRSRDAKEITFPCLEKGFDFAMQ